MLTTVLTVATETTNPASRAMDSLHAAMVFYTTGLVQRVGKKNLSCGTTFKAHVNSNPLPVIQHIYDIEENFQFI